MTAVRDVFDLADKQGWSEGRVVALILQWVEANDRSGALLRFLEAVASDESGEHADILRTEAADMKKQQFKCPRCGAVYQMSPQELKAGDPLCADCPGEVAMEMIS